MFVFEIDGVDFSRWVAAEGFKVTRADSDGPNAGRTLDAYMHRDRVATKYRLDVQLRDLWDDNAHAACAAMLPEYVTVTYSNPYTGAIETVQMYSNNNVATLVMSMDGHEWWTFDAFPLIER